MKILYIASNPEGASPLQIEKEANLLREKLDGVETSEPIDLRVYSALDVGTLPDVIVRAAPNVIHFAAHGKDGGIALAHQDRGHVVLDGDMLADILLALAVRPRLVVVNACDSAPMARALLRAADFAIGTDAPVSNVGARTMAATMYQRLADGASVHDAYVAAAAMLRLIDCGTVAAVLHPEDGVAAARRVRLADPLRILACFPVVDKWLRHGHVRPRKGFEPEEPEVGFGLAGCPSNVRQVQLFSDDETIRRGKGQSLADARSWLVEAQAVDGEVWMDKTYSYYGDMQWYGSVTTSDRRILSTASTMADALERYYFVEGWRGDVPDEIAEMVRASILSLRENGGSRRRRDAEDDSKVATRRKA